VDNATPKRLGYRHPMMMFHDEEVFTSRYLTLMDFKKILY